MEPLEKFIIEAFKPYLVPFAFGIFYALFRFRDKIFGIEKKAPRRREYEKDDDVVLKRFLDSHDKLSAAHYRIADAIEKNGDKIESLAIELRNTTDAIRDAFIDLKKEIEILRNGNGHSR